MITDILYRCPSCGSFDWMDGSRCIACSATVNVISRTQVEISGERNTIAHWYRKILSFELPADDSRTILNSGRVILSRGCAWISMVDPSAMNGSVPMVLRACNGWLLQEDPH